MPIGAAVAAGVVAFAGIFVLHDDAHYVFDGLTSRALPLVIISAVCGLGSLVLLVRERTRGARVLAVGAVADRGGRLGRRAMALHPAHDAQGVPGRRAPTRRSPRSSSCSCVAAVVILPSLGFLYVLDQKSMLDVDARQP